MWEILKSIDLSPLYISLKTGVVATIIAFFVGTFAAGYLMKVPEKIKWILDGVFTLPLVLPPTVAGFLLLMLFSLKRPVGQFLYEGYGIKLIQTWAGCVAAAFVIAFPLMYRNARAAFEQIDVNIIYAGRTLGLSERRIFWRVIMPVAAPGIASGTILAFTRAIGEYGATAMLAGNILGKTKTAAVAIASETAAGNYQTAGLWAVVMIVIAFIMILTMNIISGRGMKQIRRWK